MKGPRIASIRTLLDVDAMSSVLLSLPAFSGVDGESVRLGTLWAKPGRHFNATYTLLPAGHTQRMTVSAFLVDAERGRRVVEKTREHTCDREPQDRCRRCATAFIEPDVLIQPFPLDYRLPTLKRCLDLLHVRRLAPQLQVLAREVKAYRPGMRCLLQYRTASGADVFGKVAVERRGPGTAFAILQRLDAALSGARETLRTPAPISYLEDLHLTLAARVEGASLHDLLAESDDLEGPMARVAIALATLHGLGAAPGDRVFTCEDEMELLEGWVHLSAAVRPELADHLEGARTAMARARPPAIAARAMLHRDFYDKQILLAPGQPPAFLDLDTACAGDPELDVGNCLAHLELRGMQHELHGRCKALGETLEQSYPRSLDPVRTDWYRRASLLRLACNYSLRPRWRHIAADVVAAASRERTHP